VTHVGLISLSHKIFVMFFFICREPPAPLTIRVNVCLQGGIKTIESPTHKVDTVEKGPIPEKPHWSRAVVELHGKTTDMDRDFVLFVIPEDIHVPRLYSEV